MVIFLFVFLCLLTLPAIIAFVRFVHKEFGECIEEPSEEERVKAKVLANYLNEATSKSINRKTEYNVCRQNFKQKIKSKVKRSTQ